MAGKKNIRNNASQDKFSSLRERNNVVKGPLNKGDARLKIIQKNRSKLVDARDRLTQMAKKTDARAKLLKLHQMRKGINTLNSETVQPVGRTILKKTDRNGKISLSTNKPKKSSEQSHMNMALCKEIDLIANRRKFPLARSSRGQGVKQIRNTRLMQSPYRKPVNPLSEPNRGYHRNIEMQPVYAGPTPIIKRTIHNDIVGEIPTIREFPNNHTMDHNLYTWIRPESSSLSNIDSRKQSVKVTAKNNISAIDFTANDWSYADSSLRSIKMSPYFIDGGVDEFSLLHPSPQRIKTGVHARLDTPTIVPQSEGIFSHTKTKILVPVGHRIVVSNLQSTVTQDDIRELFEDVGELLISRLVRPGTAEVIYKDLVDAQKAVDTYHNRQLDGQPMKCLLVNKRPVNNPTAPAVRTAKTTSSVLRTGGVVKKSALNSKNSSKLIPDISTIHKVLFHKT